MQKGEKKIECHSIGLFHTAQSVIVPLVEADAGVIIPFNRFLSTIRIFIISFPAPFDYHHPY